MDKQFKPEGGNAARIKNSQPGILEVRSGSGGREAQTFAQMILRMYIRFAERQGIGVEILADSVARDGGLRSATLKFERGLSYLQREAGVHRLQRISPFGKGERHTSFCEVSVLGIPPPSQTVWNDKEIRLDFLRGTGPGGQARNKTSSGVRAVHLPSGLMATCLSGRSQWQNRQAALLVLRARVGAAQKAEEPGKGEWEGQSWGRQVRTYQMAPERVVRDHRSGKRSPLVERILDGEVELIRE